MTNWRNFRICIAWHCHSCPRTPVWQDTHFGVNRGRQDWQSLSFQWYLLLSQPEQCNRSARRSVPQPVQSAHLCQRILAGEGWFWFLHEMYQPELEHTDSVGSSFIILIPLQKFWYQQFLLSRRRAPGGGKASALCTNPKLLFFWRQVMK